MINHSIKPGQVWLDTDGKRIQAHAGAVFYENGTYYWYGENKEKTDGKSEIWTWGIRCYSSKDLYNWQDEGLIIEPVTDDESSLLHPNHYMDRPHIIYNEKTEKYVCWLKFSGDIGCFSVMTADSLLGPYTMVRDYYRPYGKQVGDFDIIRDEESGKAYIYFEYDHYGVAAYELSEDYTSTAGEPKLYYSGLHAPFTREGVTRFVRNGKQYLLTSGMTGYVPNPSEVAVLSDWLGDMEIQGNPHVNDYSGASFNSQVSAVFKVPDKDLYIAIADRWDPNNLLTKNQTEAITRVVASQFDQSYQVQERDYEQMIGLAFLESLNTSISDYVWLPVRFEKDRAFIEWKDEWRIEDYQKGWGDHEGSGI